jgi:hypothetical protein
MRQRRWSVLAAGVLALSLTPVVVHAGVGGSPVPPGAAAAGSATTYCCTAWTERELGKGGKAITVFDGAGCSAIAPDESSANSCNLVSGKVLKCRGELYTPGSGQNGTVERCLSP